MIRRSIQKLKRNIKGYWEYRKLKKRHENKNRFFIETFADVLYKNKDSY